MNSIVKAALLSSKKTTEVQNEHTIKEQAAFKIIGGGSAEAI